MPVEHSARWDGQERRTSERLRRLITDIQEQLLALRREVVAHGVKIANLEELMFGESPNDRRTKP